MKRFLRETWELWYWAMFCPSRLQQRMNAWTPNEEKDQGKLNINFSRIFLLHANPRFVKQYLLLVFLFSFPLAITIFIYGHSLEHWLLLPMVFLTAYLTGIWYVPFGLHIPLFIWSSVILWLSEDWSSDILWLSQDSKTSLPRLLILLALWLSGVCLSLTRAKPIIVFRVFVITGWKTLLLSCFNNLYVPLFLLYPQLNRMIPSEILSFLVSLMTNFFFIIGYFRLFPDYVILSLLSFKMSFFDRFSYLKACQIYFLIVSSFFVGYFGTVTFPLIFYFIFFVQFLVVAYFSIIGCNLFTQKRWKLVLIFWVGYFQIIPDYLALILALLLGLLIFGIHLDPNPDKRMYVLPPYTHELVLLPLPGHGTILVEAFRSDISAALTIFQKMQSSALPAVGYTIQKVLLQIIIDQFTAVENVQQLASTATSEHSSLPLLLPSLYKQEEKLQRIEENFHMYMESQLEALQEKEKNFRLYVESKLEDLQSQFETLQEKISEFVGATLPISKNDITIIRRLKTIASDVAVALELGSSDLRSRSLKQLLNKIEILPAQLPKIGLEVQEIKRWEPVLKRWQIVVQRELEQQQAQSQGELPNPFQYGNPLKKDRAQLFKGRTAFTEQLIRLILDRDRPTLVLHGPRRCGKSSFLLNLPRLLPSDLIPVYLDLQSAAITTDEAAFCYSLVRTIHRDSRSQGIDLPSIPPRDAFHKSPYIALEDWLEKALPELGDRRLLLNLDEFEKIGSAIKEGRISLNLFDELRHLIQHYDQIGFLFSGVQTLDELGPNWSSYFISVVPIEMLYLQPHEAEDLLTNPDPNFTLRYNKGIVAEILALTHCHPYLLQLIGSALVNQANLIHTQLVTSNLLQAAITEAFTLGGPYFTNVWTEFTGTSPTEVKMGQNLLLTLAQGHQPAFEVGNEMLVRAHSRTPLQKLLRYHVIEHTADGYRIEIPLLERWVRERAVQN